MSAPQRELCDWLKLATQGLPRKVRAVVAKELVAHYDDALLDHIAQGVSRDEAHHNALAELGDPRVTALALRTTYQLHHRYLWAMMVALAALTSIAAGALFTTHLYLLSVIGVASTLYLLRTFKRLIETRIDAPRIGWWLALIEIGVLLSAIVGLVGWQNSRDYPVAFVLTDPVVLAGDNLYEQGLSGIHVLLAVSIVGVGLGWIFLSERLIDYRESFFGVGPLLRLFVFVNGLALAAVGFSLLLRNPLALQATTPLVAITGVGRQTLFMLLFYRAASRRSKTPQRRLHA